MKVALRVPKSSVGKNFFYSFLLGFLIIAFTNIEKLTRSLDDLSSSKIYCGVVTDTYLSQGRGRSASWILKLKSGLTVKTFNLSGPHFDNNIIQRGIRRGDNLCISYLEPKFPRLSLFITQIENKENKLLEQNKVEKSFLKVNSKVWYFALALLQKYFFCLLF